MLHLVVPRSKKSSREVAMRPALFRRKNTRKEISAVVHEDVALSIPGVRTKALPKSPEKFFKELSRFANFNWRDNGNAVEIAVVPGKKGFWIGHRGSRVRALSAHLGKEINLVDGVLAVNKLLSDERGGSFKVRGAVVLQENELRKRAIGIHRDPQDFSRVRSGYVAPWDIA